MPPITDRLPRARGSFTSATWLAVAAAATAGCASAPAPRAVVVEPLVTAADPLRANFDCRNVETPPQAYVCGDADLAASDFALGQLWREQLRRQDFAGRAELLSSQRRWQRGLYAQCKLDFQAGPRAPLQAQTMACLKQAWAARSATLRAWPQPAVVQPDAPNAQHPLAAYVALRSAQSLEPALCAEVGARLNALIGQGGTLNPARVPGWRVLAGTHGPAQAQLPDGRRVEVLSHDAGPYGGYDLRAVALQIDGQRIVDPQSLGRWTLTLPNAGGSFNAGSSQTGDMAGIDVFTRDLAGTQRSFVLVNQTWGYYASAARGESPHAGLYELTAEPDAKGLQPRCLWRTYIAPPVANALRLLPRFKALLALLDQAAGPDAPQLAPEDRRDAKLLAEEAQWNLLNMPLLAQREARLHGRWPLLRQRHDEALEALFAWSERNVPSKLLYRRVMPAIAPAHAELLAGFQGAEGLNPTEARAAADLVLMAALDRAAERLQDPVAPRPAPAGSAYKPKFAVAPAAGNLERGRDYGSLHSALLARAAPEVIDDFMRFTWGSTERVGDPAKGAGPAGDTPLMAAVRSPALVQRLLAAGAEVNGRNAWGKTALMTAAQADQPESVRALLTAGADPQLRTVAWQADGAGGPDNDEGTAYGVTALTYAVAGARAAVVDALLASGAKLGLTPTNRATVADLLAGNPHLTDAERTRLVPLLHGR